MPGPNATSGGNAPQATPGWAVSTDQALVDANLAFVSGPITPWPMGGVLERNTCASRSLILGDKRDIASRALFCRGAKADRWNGLRAAAESAIHVLGPLALTSVFRPTGTHQYAAIDLAPVVRRESAHRFASSDQVRRPLMLYARLPVVVGCCVLSMRHPWLTIGIEDNHFHFQDDRWIPRSVRASIPRDRVLVKSESRGTAKADDYDFSGEPGLYSISLAELGLSLVDAEQILQAVGSDFSLSRPTPSFDVSTSYTPSPGSHESVDTNPRTALRHKATGQTRVSSADLGPSRATLRTEPVHGGSASTSNHSVGSKLPPAAERAQARLIARIRAKAALTTRF